MVRHEDSTMMNNEQGYFATVKTLLKFMVKDRVIFSSKNLGLIIMHLATIRSNSNCEASIRAKLAASFSLG